MESSLVFLKTIDRENTDFMLNRLSSQFTNEISKIEYKEFKDELQGLLEGNTDAIIMNEGMRDAFNIIDRSFEKETRVIYTLDRKEVLKNLKANNITKDPFIVYISGIDTNGSISKTSRSDVNMLAAVNPKKKELLLVFIPRDYYVPLQCPNGSCETGAMDKLTHAGLYGVETSQATLSKLFDIKINYNVRLNFDTLTTMVDALDGIDIYSDKELAAYTNKNCSYVKGNQYVDGACALAFARERYAYETGDRHRGENQQQVIEAMLKKFTKSNVIKNYESIMNAVQGMFQTNMTTDEITALIQMQIDDMATWKVTSISADGTGDMLPTYSFGRQPLYVMHPKENAIVNIKKILKNIL
ncbi:MAG: LCP family protein [[Clostridium] innocuum]